MRIMRDSGKTGYDFWGKAHLGRLPNLTEETPRVEIPSKRLLMLFPFFKGNGTDTYLMDGGVIGGIWARHTWLKHTDALNYGIEMKFYIDEKVKDIAFPIFEANGIDTDHLLFFDSDPIEREDLGRDFQFTKKLAAFGDDRFKDYDWIIIIDCDIFAMSFTGEPVPFFEKFFNGCIEGQIGNMCAMAMSRSVPLNWIERLIAHKNRDHNDSWEALQQNWRLEAEKIISKEDVAVFWDPQRLSMICSGFIHAYPAKAMMQNPENAEWFINAARIMQDDEAVIALWWAKGEPVWDMRQRLKFNEVFIGPTIVGQDYEDFKAFVDSDTPFIFHYSVNPVDLEFRRGIGALD